MNRPADDLNFYRGCLVVVALWLAVIVLVWCGRDIWSAIFGVSP